MNPTVAEIDWKPDRGSDEPVYRQIVHYVMRRICSGAWTVGCMLPSQRTLAEKFGVNRSTVIMALDELASYGMLDSKIGRGTAIASNTWSVLMAGAPPDWGRYLRAGSFRENVPTIQAINRLEFEEGVIRLGTGELSPELFPNEVMAECLRRFQKRMPPLNYVEPLGLPELRQAISRRLAGVGIEAPPSSILITSGSLQALQLISVGILRRGAVVYTEAPSYVKSLQVFQSAGVELRGVPMDGDGVLHWHIAMERKESRDALLYTIPSFHNPTGILMSESRRRELFRFCAESRLPVIEDDAYGELWLDAEPPRPMKATDRSGMILYTGTISKTLAPGLRIGWLVGPEPVVTRLGDVKMQVDYGASSLSQWILTELLSSGLYDEYLRDLREKLRRRRELALRLLEEHFKDLAEWETPKGGFYIWLRMKSGVSTSALFHAALREKVLINPGGVYDPGRDEAVRLSYAYASEGDLRKGVATLAKTARGLSRLRT